MRRKLLNIRRSPDFPGDPGPNDPELPGARRRLLPRLRCLPIRLEVPDADDGQDQDQDQDLLEIVPTDIMLQSMAEALLAQGASRSVGGDQATVHDIAHPNISPPRPRPTLEVVS